MVLWRCLGEGRKGDDGGCKVTGTRAAEPDIELTDRLIPLCRLRLLSTWPGVVAIREVQMAHSTFGRENNHSDNASGAAVPFDSFSKRAFDERNALPFCHAVFPIGIRVAVDVCRTTATNGKVLLVE